MTSPDPERADAWGPRRPAQSWQLAIISRLMMIVPISLGTLGVEVVFAGRAAGSAIAVGAAALTFFLLWIGLAWALRSWVAMLVTFIPAIMVTVGGAMVLDLAPASGGILLVAGLALTGSVIWYRIARPTTLWGGSMGRGTDRSAGHSAMPLLGGATDGSGRPASRQSGSGQFPSSAQTPSDPQSTAARSLSAQSPSAQPTSAPHRTAATQPIASAPDWDTSATRRRTRDAFVLSMCQRGGTSGPVLVTLEEFFTGNGDARSIAPGLRGAVSLSRFATVLHSLRARSDVEAVMIQLEPLEPGEYQLGQWPTAGGVHVIGSISGTELDDAVAPLQAETAIGPLPVTELPDGSPAKPDAAEFAIWWA